MLIVQPLLYLQIDMGVAHEKSGQNFYGKAIGTSRDLLIIT